MTIAGKKVLALITARGKSKRLPHKNILDFNGKPLVYWSIRAAQESRHVDLVSVSTEDIEIANVSKRTGAKVPFIRPTSLASDKASSMEVVLHAMDFYESQNQPFDILLLLQPTSPLRTAALIDAALSEFISKKAKAVVSVCELGFPLQWTRPLGADLCVKSFNSPGLKAFPSSYRKTKIYRLNGAIYIADWDYLKKHRSWYSKKSYAFVMDKLSSIDIDTEEDFMMAEAAMSLRNSGSKKKVRQFS